MLVYQQIPDDLFREEFPDLFYRHPEKDNPRLLEFSHWLDRHRNETVLLYHGTAKKHSILEKGFLPSCPTRAKSLQSAAGYVCFSIFPSSAETFGKMAYPSQETCVYAIRLPIAKLQPDKDQLRNRRYWSEMTWLQDTLCHSLVYGYGCRVRGKVSPSAIVGVSS